MALPLLRRRDWPAMGLAPISSIQNEFNRLQRELNQLFPSMGIEEPEALAAFAPDVDVYEDEKGIRLRADVPGIDRKDIDIKVRDNMLTVSGKREQAKEEKRENYQRMERSYGEFSRSFTLPDYADSDKIEAKFNNGVLEVFVPCKPEVQSKAKKIEIKAT